jgi:hypothetical protein
MKRLIGIVIALALWPVSVPVAEAINITLAEVQNGVAVVQGNKAAKKATISWETSSVGQTSNGGSFSFSGIVPADCVGELSVGEDTINVALANCTPPVSSVPAPVPKTGQTKCWDVLGNEIACAGTGHDGEIQAGVALPSPRFTDNGDGTVTDNGTGLIWLKDGKCLDHQEWATAFAVVHALADGNLACGLTDHSVAGDWRLPNRNELTSLLDLGTFGLALPSGHPFVNYEASSLTSTTLASNPARVWMVSLSDGLVFVSDKSSAGSFITAVRGPLSAATDTAASPTPSIRAKKGK